MKIAGRSKWTALPSRSVATYWKRNGVDPPPAFGIDGQNSACPLPPISVSIGSAMSGVTSVISRTTGNGNARW